MSAKRPPAWVGDQVYDADAGREGMEVVLPRDERLKRHREHGW
jgi:hypothetical protein